MVDMRNALLGLKTSKLSDNEFYFVLHSNGDGVGVYADYNFKPSKKGLLQCARFLSALEIEIDKFKGTLNGELLKLKEDGNW